MALMRFRPSARALLLVAIVLIGLHVWFSGPAIPAAGTDTPDWHTSTSPADHRDDTVIIKPNQGSTDAHDASYSPIDTVDSQTPSKSDPPQSKTESAPSACMSFAGNEDVVYIIKTGATEVDERLPVHFDSSMKCWTHSLIFADYAEKYRGHAIMDALEGITDQIRLEDKQFDLWRRLNKTGRTGLDEKELSTHHQKANPNDGGGNFDSGGWVLDKFKNIPMVVRTLALKPDAKWFIFTDADTFIAYSNLLRWTQKLDPTKVWYFGNPAMIDGQVFGHGGTGYLLSRPAMEIVAEYYRKSQQSLDELALHHWAGDCVLAIALAHQNVSLSWGYPLLHGGDPLIMDYRDYGYDKKIWCYPAVSYHHILPTTVQGLWEFEQDWLASDKKDQAFHHSDVWRGYVLPYMQDGERDGWNNTAGTLHETSEDAPIQSFGACRKICEDDSKCMQFVYGEGKCYTTDKIKVGGAAKNEARSGWLVDRIKKTMDDFDTCKEGDWLYG